jgi:integrase
MGAAPDAVEELGEEESMAIIDVQDDFRMHVERTERSPSTAQRYAADAAEFEVFRAGRTPLLDAYEAWVASLQERLTPQTVARKRAAVNRWLSFLARHGDGDAAAAVAILKASWYQVGRSPREADYALRIPATAEDYARIRAVAPPWVRAVAAVLWWAGPRISEVVGDGTIPPLTAQHGRELVRQRWTRTVGKGGKLRWLVVPAAGARELTAWVEAAGDGWLFPSPRRAHAVSRQAVDRALRRLVGKGAHAFRHAYRARLRRAGVRPELMAALLGHGPRSVTDRYGRITVEELLEAADCLEEESHADR